MKTRESLLDLGGPIRPVIDTSGSDSAMLDNAIELLLRGGRDVRHAIAMLAPQAWEKTPDLPQHIRDFDAATLAGRRIATANHCYGCTAGAGSSCGGVVA
jgi:glutamate synthase domain-containing protein 1